MSEANHSSERVCLITGVGPGTGAALVRRFVEGDYRVAMLARNEERLKKLEAELEGTRAYVCDVVDEAALDQTIASVKKDLGVPTIVVHNAVGGAFGSFQEIDPQVLRQNFEVNTMALLHLARLVVDDMIAEGGGAIIATGNTSAYRGKAAFAGFAPSKAAQRILLESIARSAGPKGVHAAYLAIDAVIDLEWTRKRMPDAPDDFFCKPADIAEAAYQLVHQPKSAWAFEMVIRPFGETW